MAALRSRCGYYVLPYGFYLSSSFFLAYYLGRRRLDVYHTSTHDVALVWIYNACLKCAARGSLKIQDAKITPKSPSTRHRTTLSGSIFATKARIANRKKIVKQQYLPHMSSQYGELRPTNGWDRFGSLGQPFQWVSRLDSVTPQQHSIGRQPNFAALNRGRHLHSAWRPSRWTLAHILV